MLLKGDRFDGGILVKNNGATHLCACQIAYNVRYGSASLCRPKTTLARVGVGLAQRLRVKLQGPGRSWTSSPLAASYQPPIMQRLILLF